RMRGQPRDRESPGLQRAASAAGECRRGDRMRRREFITLLGGAAAAWPVAGRGQQNNAVRWIGVLMISPDNDLYGRDSAEVFEQSLAKLGWTVGRNLAIDYRWAVSDLGKARLAVGQIMRLTPSVILANGGPAL